MHPKDYSSGIFIRENGATKEISEAEWRERFPDRQPVKVQMPETETDQVYSRNITHNLGKMADKAGIYEALWRPEEKDWKVAKDLIAVLEFGLANLKGDPDFFKEFNPDNGWGDYAGLVSFVESYLAACQQYPDAKVRVSR